jgi:hypothetical protein
MAKKEQLEPVLLEGVRILFRNFSGLPGRYNAKGARNFNVALDSDTAEAMMKDGWNVRFLQPREGYGDELQPILEVAVKYPAEGGRGSTPRVYLITSRGKTPLMEDMLPILDWAEIENVDMIIRPYMWEVSGKKGVKAYLKAIYVTVVEDALELKYVDVPDSAGGNIMIPPEPEAEEPI